MLRRSSRNVESGDHAANLVLPTMKLSAEKATGTTEADEFVDMEYEDWDESDKTSEEEDSDYESKQQNKNKSPKKRPKTRQTIATSSSKSVRRKSLNLLPTMPLDILFEIFSHLVPKDIISLSRTSKSFHETLSNRNASSAWKTARERISAPDGPDWMNEGAWAALLFGHICQSCGTTNVHKVDFFLLKRICLSCKKRHFVLRSKIEKRYPNADFVILDLVPSTNISPWSTWARTSYYYWDWDIESMLRKLAALKDEVDVQQMTVFMEAQKRRLQCIRQNSSSWDKWYEGMQEQRSQDTKDAEERRLLQIKNKFKELGYIEEDLLGLDSRKECKGKAQLTDKIWGRVRPILEPDVQARKLQRLEVQLAGIKCNRREILATRYKEFQRTHHPSQWKYLPRTLEISAFKPFARHIEADVGVEIDGTTFDDAFLELPSLLAAASKQRKATLRALISGTPTKDREIPEGDPLDLATAVFKCTEGHNYLYPMQYVFGWDEVASHHCLHETEGILFSYRPESSLRTTPAVLKHCPEIAKVVGKLAQLAGLDAATATAADFDRKNLRFSCESCKWFKEGGRFYRFGYSWRNLAIHLEAQKSHNPNSLITVLSDNSANEVKQCEQNDTKWTAHQWTCSHCSEYLDYLQRRQVIVEHLSTSHGIRTPLEPRDLFFFERFRRDWTTKPKFSVPEPQNFDAALKIYNAAKDITGKFRCLMCPLNTRLFVFNGVKDHLRAKHNISIGQGGVHYSPA